MDTLCLWGREINGSKWFKAVEDFKTTDREIFETNSKLNWLILLNGINPNTDFYHQAFLDACRYLIKIHPGINLYGWIYDSPKNFSPDREVVALIGNISKSQKEIREDYRKQLDQRIQELKEYKNIPVLAERDFEIYQNTPISEIPEKSVKRLSKWYSKEGGYFTISDDKK